MRRITLRGPWALALSLGVARLAFAEDKATFRLAFTREPAAAACPDAAGLRAAVTAKLGYDPFRDDAPRTLAVTFGRSGVELRAQVQLRDETGAVTGTRALKSTVLGCGPLAEDVAQAIAIVVDPLYLTPPAPVAPSAEPVASAPAPPDVPPEPTVPLPTPTASPPTALELSAGGLISAGASPAGLGAGLLVGVGVHRGRGSLSLEGRLDREGSRGAELGGEVRGAILAGMLVPCFHEGPFRACALAQVGAFLGASADIDAPRRAATTWVALGGRIGVEVPLTRELLLLRLGVDVLGTLTRTELDLHGQAIWVSPALSGAFSVALLARFFP